MPDIVVHNAMGDKVLAGLEPEIRRLIEPEIFRFAVMGPDPYIFYRFFALPFRHGVNKRSTVMHETKCAAFLVALAKRGQSREMFSFTAGFLCHYALDSTTHPFINGLAGEKSGIHAAIEHKLDVLELEHQGKQLYNIMDLFTAFPELPEVKEAIREVYGWNDETYRAGYQHMKLFHWIAKDQHGCLNACLRWLPGKLSTVSYRNHKGDPFDLSAFHALEDQSVSRGIELINALFRYCNGEIDEERFRIMIGNRSYTGEEITENP